MSEVSVTQIQLLPMLSVQVGDQAPLLLDPDTAGELLAALYAVLGDGETHRQGFEAGQAAATFQRPTVWFSYNGARRNVIPVTIKEGTDDLLLVGLELTKEDGQPPYTTPQVRAYRTGLIVDVSEGHPTSWKMADA